MDRSTTIGYVLILLIFVGYWFIQKGNVDKLKEQEALRIQDSIAAIETNPIIVDSHATANVQAADKLDQLDTETEKVEENVIEQQWYNLKNDQFELTFSNRGGHIAKVNLLEYKRNDKSPLILFEEEQNFFNLSIPLKDGSHIETKDLDFKLSEQEDNSVKLIADLGQDRNIVFTYGISDQKYKIDYQIELNGLGNALSTKNQYLGLDWITEIQLQEKSITDERSQSGIFYKYNDDKDVDNLSIRKDEDDEKLQANLEWICYKQKFFNISLISETAFGEDGTKIIMETPETEDYIKKFTTNSYLPITLGSQELYNFEYFIGPNHYQTLKGTGNRLHEIIDLGYSLFDWVSKVVIIPLFNWLAKYITNYGLLILVLTLIIKLSLFFPMYKSYVSQAKMRLLKPELDILKEKTGGDASKMQQEQMKLYKKAGVSPLGGCLPQLVQMPILFSMFYFFPAAIELRQKSFLHATDLSVYDSIWNFPNGFSIPMYGDHVSLFTLLMTVTTIAYTYFNSQMSGGLSGQFKYIMYFMPLIFLGIFNNYAAALSLYYFISTLITMIINFVIRKFIIDEDKLRKEIEDNKKRKIKPKKKSGFQKRLEKMAKERGIDLNNPQGARKK